MGTSYKDALEVARKYGARICYLTRDGSIPDDLEEGEVIFPDYSLRGSGYGQTY